MSKSIVITGDIGGEAGYHVGDEAMFASNLAHFRRIQPDLRITALTRDPHWTASQYQVDALPVLGFSPEEGPAGEVDRQAMWEDLSDPEQAAPIREAIASADALVISGGGNLRSFWAAHIYDRAALIRMASEAGKRIIVMGQTVGPDLEPVHRELLRSQLALAHLIVAREQDSTALLRSLGLGARLLADQLDDAWFLAGEPTAVPFDLQKPWIAVSLSPLESVLDLAPELNALQQATGADLVFLPHFDHDIPLANSLIEKLDHPERAHLLPLLLAPQVSWLTQQASLVIASRYHACVFGLSGAVPSLGIYSSEYGRIRHVGVQRHANTEFHALDFPKCLAGGLASAAIHLWQDRSAARQHLVDAQDRWRRQDRTKWDLIAQLLSHRATPGDANPTYRSASIGVN